MTQSRQEAIKSMLWSDGHGLEIGPSHSPMFPKREGYNVDTLDHAIAAELRAKYAADPTVNVEAIEEVDYVSDGRAIHEVIGRQHCYDFVYSSHVIEHVTDFVAYFQSCEALLKPNGVAVLSIPDKRFTFDALQQLTSTGDVLEAHHNKAMRHSPSRVFDFIANFASMDGVDTWSLEHRGPTLLRNDVTAAKAWFDMASADPKYIDVHGWRFTPTSFRLLMHDLNVLGLCSLREVQMSENGSFEFVVSLSKQGAGTGRSRIDLVHGIQLEVAVGALQGLAPHSAWAAEALRQHA